MTDLTCRAALADERAKFEAWIKDKHGVSKKSNPWPVWVDEKDGTYVYSQDEWEAWQGRAALSQEAVPTGFVMVPRKTLAFACAALSQILPCAHPDCKVMENESADRTCREISALLASAPQPQDTKGNDV